MFNKTEEVQKDNKNKMIKELKGVISYAKFDHMEYCKELNLNYFDFDDHINTNKLTNVILYVYEDYKNIY
jgi:hypothetical protein